MGPAVTTGWARARVEGQRSAAATAADATEQERIIVDVPGVRKPWETPDKSTRS
jgi:hypothetical protein